MSRKAVDVQMVEVGPRDGLQNESLTLSMAQKTQLIQLLSQSGLRTIEIGSFVSPQKIPQLQDTAEVFKAVRAQALPGKFPVLVPNIQGLNNALSVGVTEVSVFIAASETFSQKNINCSIAESLQRVELMRPIIKQHGLTLRGYISCTLGCPFEGAVPVSKVVDLSQTLLQLGCEEISLGDTIGVGTVRTAEALIKSMKSEIPTERIAIHFHDTYGQALANIYACLNLGIRIIDSSITGLGGCPYAPGASGNVATEDVLYLLDGLGLSSGVEMSQLLKASRFVSEVFGEKPRSKTAQALLSRR